MTDLKELTKRVLDLLNGSDRVEINIRDENIEDIVGELRKAKPRRHMITKHGVAFDFPQGNSNTLTIYRPGASGTEAEDKAPVVPEKQAAKPTPKPKVKRHQHSYKPPSIGHKIIDVLTDAASMIIHLVGPTQCGKTMLVGWLGEALGRKVYKINCRGDMGSEAFFGEKTVTIDEDTAQNQIEFVHGIIEQAMTEGLDENGNEVGEPGILFLDELPACPAHIAHGLNGLFEEGDGGRRSILLDLDGGRKVTSHSQFRILTAGNTIGRGALSQKDIAYAAQNDRQDASLLERITFVFRMGYDKTVEKHILAEKIGDDKISQLILRFRDAIRSAIMADKLSSDKMFSTKTLVDIANAYRIWKDAGAAIYYTVMEKLSPEEQAVYNEQAMAIFGLDILNKYQESDVDYM